MQPFDQRDGQIWLNGALIPWKKAQIHFLTHGLHYASSVFEGIGVYNGKIFKSAEHMQRLHESAHALGFKLPFTIAELVKAAKEITISNNLKDAYIRPCAWQGSEIIRIYGSGNRIHVGMAGWSYKRKNIEDKMLGITMMTSPWATPSPNTAPVGSKSAGIYMIYTLSRKIADEHGFDDALMLDWRGQVAEAAGANIFFVMNGILHTPTPDCFLNGITRQIVIEIAHEQGIEVVERVILPHEIEKADEIFITGTSVEILPVRKIDSWDFKPGEMCHRMIDAYERRVLNDSI